MKDHELAATLAFSIGGKPVTEAVLYEMGVPLVIDIEVLLASESWAGEATLTLFYQPPGAQRQTIGETEVDFSPGAAGVTRPFRRQLLPLPGDHSFWAVLHAPGRLTHPVEARSVFRVRLPLLH